MYLNTHTYYSLKYGTMSPRDLVDRAAAKGVKTLVLTDINNTSCAYSFVQACKNHHIKPVLGIEFRLDHRLLYIGIARNEEGWRELCDHLTKHSIAGTSLPRSAPDWRHCYTIYPEAAQSVEQLRPHEFIGIRPENVNRLHNSYLRRHLDRLVILAPVTFQDYEHYRLHKLLRCIDLNIIISKLTAGDHAKASEVFRNPGELESIYAAYPAIIANTRHILSKCSIDLRSGYGQNRQTFTGNAEDDKALLTKLAINGCHSRYGRTHRRALDRTAAELKAIEKLGFCAYFLITWDIIRYAHAAGYHHVGRGSGANSIVAYNIGITDVDPLELDLYFERFINPHRSSPPDFDIDFSWDERDDVTDYIFKRYGREHTALLATYNTFKGKSIIRELGKVLGLPKKDIDLIVDYPEAKERHHPYARHIFKFGAMMEGFPNYLSIHAGGVIISERPLSYHTARKMMPKGFPITHFDMYGAEDIGYHKYDILSQRGLGHIKDAISLIARNRGKAIDIHDITRIKKDPKVRAKLRAAECIGCFYIESPAMRGLLSKLKCDDYVHLVAASSIIRPGVAKSGMMREYIRRHHRPGDFAYLHPVFEEHLSETYGIMVYQEDVMKIVHHFSGLGLGESDVLRRIMTGKRKNSGAFQKLKDKYFSNCKARGYPDSLALEVWRQIESFGGYSFCKAHSASYAVESFQSLYLKAHYPLEFITAVINNFGGFYSTEIYFHEARMNGATIEPPCVNHSCYLTDLQGSTLYVGFVHIANLEKKIAHGIVTERLRHGPYRDLRDFVNRIDISKEQLEILIRIGAFRWTGKNKYELFWEKIAVHNPAARHAQYASLFEEEKTDYTLPILKEQPHEQAFDEIELLGFPLCSPFDLIDSAPPTDCTASALSMCTGRVVRILGYYVVRKYVRTVNKKLMNFGTWLDVEGKFFDTVHFPPSLARAPFKGKGCYIIRGKVVEDFGFPGIEVYDMERLPYTKPLLN